MQLSTVGTRSGGFLADIRIKLHQATGRSANAVDNPALSYPLVASLGWLFDDRSALPQRLALKVARYAGQRPVQRRGGAVQAGGQA